MRSFAAFLKKEWLFHLRTGKIAIVFLVFLLLGVMNPAIAKLTPWLLEAMSESLSESGMTVTEVQVDAITSWVQFFKNAPMGLIAFVFIEAGLFTDEYSSGSLVMILTKGVSRSKVFFAKTLVAFLLWSAAYWLSYLVTYGYNAYFWDNSIACELLPSGFCWWLFGAFVLSLMLFFSAILNSTSAVLLSVGASSVVFYLLNIIPYTKDHSPIAITDGNSLIYGVKAFEEYIPALLITAFLTITLAAIGAYAFKKRSI